MQSQQVPITHTQGALAQSIMHINPTADQNWCMISQQILQYEQRYNQVVNVIVELI